MSVMAHYPNYECAKHGEMACYMACEHVVSAGSAVSCVEEPDQDPGLLLCEACAAITRPLTNVNQFSPVCARCALERGWNPSWNTNGPFSKGIDD